MKNKIIHFGLIDSIEKEINIETNKLTSSNGKLHLRNKKEVLKDCLGLESIEEFNSWKNHQLINFEKIENSFLRNNSSKCTPDIGCRYYAFESKINIRPTFQRDKEVIERWLFEIAPDYKPTSLISSWVKDNEDKTLEIRKPSPDVGTGMFIDFHRNELKDTVYVINGAIELFKWLHCWGGKALILEELFEDEMFCFLLDSFECEKYGLSRLD
ncbi:hypothetical protein [Vibrio splendidus]|uniref:hypothetical protein n=1 Tax=Vibrio splendidus TaxID=29497 RepID=UPI000D379584|nr:hypothetical protein [Vibrio splendidus]PTP75250.1 hypothetical protein CWO00_13300 [Vibrio splendidus]